MSRLLAELLQMPELHFRSRLYQLEQAAGCPSSDVRLTSKLIIANRQKLKALGLDSADTRPAELYGALNHRYTTDNKRLLQALAREGRLTGEAHEVMTVVKAALIHLQLPEQCLAVKPAVAKRFFKLSPPKITMRQLGYRSIDSLTKHEPLAAIQMAAEVLEPPGWQRSYAKTLAHLSSTDFEVRRLQIVFARHDRWQKLAGSPAFRRQRHIVAVPLSASLLLLPFGAEAPPAATLSSLVVAVTAINHLAAASSYLKLHQMRPDFGQAILQLRNQPSTPFLELLGEPVSWQLVQRYYHRFKDLYRAELFEPYLQPEDFSWLGAEAALRHLAPDLDFWQGTAPLGFLRDNSVVSYNLHDVALNAANGLEYDKRLTGHFREALWHELMMGYLQPQQVEQALLMHMQPAMAEAGR